MQMLIHQKMTLKILEQKISDKSHQNSAAERGGQRI